VPESLFIAELPICLLKLHLLFKSMDITWNLLVATGPLLSYQSLLNDGGLFTSFPN